MDDDDIENAIEDCQSATSASNCPFNEWEEEFIESIAEQWSEKSYLTEKQMDTLQRIWDKV